MCLTLAGEKTNVSTRRAHGLLIPYGNFYKVYLRKSVSETFKSLLFPYPGYATGVLL